MPTLLEAWLADQTAEHLPWQHLLISDNQPAFGSATTECRPFEDATNWVGRWRRAVAFVWDPL